MYEQSCIVCGVRFSIPDVLDNQLRECHNTFYCPKGHKQFYSGESKTEKLTRERDKYLRWYKEKRDSSDRLKRRISALQGVITRMKNKFQGEN